MLERTNARGLAELPFRPDLLVCDVSFIGVRLVLPPVLRLLEPGYDALVLVKPQFEAGQAEVGKEASSAIRRSSSASSARWSTPRWAGVRPRSAS